MGPSVTTYSNYNMGYRIYIIDGDYAETTNVSLLVTAIQLYLLYSVVLEN